MSNSHGSKAKRPASAIWIPGAVGIGVATALVAMSVLSILAQSVAHRSQERFIDSFDLTSTMCFYGYPTIASRVSEAPEVVSLSFVPPGSRTIGDADIRGISVLRSLERLNLSNTSITDVGVSELRGMQSIKDLTLSGLPITDDSVAALSTLAGLQLLDISSTAISRSAALSLQRRLPDTTILWNAPQNDGSEPRPSPPLQ